MCVLGIMKISMESSKEEVTSFLLVFNIFWTSKNEIKFS
jgi:hypothetical protein